MGVPARKCQVRRLAPLWMGLDGILPANFPLRGVGAGLRILVEFGFEKGADDAIDDSKAWIHSR